MKITGVEPFHYRIQNDTNNKRKHEEANCSKQYICYLTARIASNNVAMIASIGMMTVIVNLLAMVFGNETKVIDNTIHRTYSNGNIIITTPQMWQLVSFR